MSVDPKIDLEKLAQMVSDGPPFHRFVLGSDMNFGTLD